MLTFHKRKTPCFVLAVRNVPGADGTKRHAQTPVCCFANSITCDGLCEVLIPPASPDPSTFHSVMTPPRVATSR